MGLVVCFFIMNGGNISAEEGGAISPHYGVDVTVISQGETKFIEVQTNGRVPLGDIHFLVVLIVGSGELAITMEKSDIGGELVIMSGSAFSSNGSSGNIFKMGFTPDALSDTVEIGDEETPGGFLLLFTGVLFSLGGVRDEGAYSIELSF